MYELVKVSQTGQDRPRVDFHRNTQEVEEHNEKNRLVLVATSFALALAA